jgi:hypothetical protein
MIDACYRTIVVDPPWDHSDGTGKTFGIGDTVKRPIPGGPRLTAVPYPTMTLEEISVFPLGIKPSKYTLKPRKHTERENCTLTHKPYYHTQNRHEYERTCRP